MAQFRTQYKNPIENARTKNSRPNDIRFGNQRAAELTEMTERFILRRTKDSVNKAKAVNNEQPQFPKLGMKHDFILWCKMTEKQLKMYKEFLSSDEVRHALMSKASPLVQCTVLKKLCDHPRRLTLAQCKFLGLQTGFDESIAPDNNQVASDFLRNIDLETLLEESGKLRALSNLVDILNGKFLLFSSSVKLLDMIEKLLLDKNYKLLRMDGRDKSSRRQELVEQFQRDKSINAMLLTTGVGSVGLTLTAATRVIIFDPAWNPSSDDQAVDRAYRIGQNKPVVVFRFITCDTIEERIYRRQIFKKSIIAQNNGEIADPFRHFSKDDIRQLFKCPEQPDQSETQIQLSALAERRESYEELDKLLQQLYQMETIHAGIHDHNMVFDPKNQTLVFDAMTGGDNIAPAPLGEVLRSKGNHDWKDPYAGSRINVPLNESQLRQNRIDQFLNREAETSKFNDEKLKEEEMAPKASGSNHWHMTEDPEPEIQPKVKPEFKPNPQFFTNPNVIDLVESSDDDIEIVGNRKPFVMDLTVDENNFKKRPSNVFESTIVQRAEAVNQSFEKPKPKQLSRLLSEVDDEIESLNESVEAMDVDSSGDSDALVINESPQQSKVRTPEQTKPHQPFITPGRVKQSEFKMANVTLDSSSSSLERSLDLSKNTSEVLCETLSEDEEMETNPNSSDNLFDQSESVQSSQPVSEPAQTPSTKFRRRSQLPFRPETRDDSADAEIEDFNGSIIMSGRKSRRILVSESDSSEDEVMSQSPIGPRRILGELSMNKSSEPVKKNRQLYIDDSDTDDNLEVVESSD